MTHILVTNDDGVTAPGLFALVDALRGLGDVSVLAPDRNWSASGHVKTMHKPLRVRSSFKTAVRLLPVMALHLIVLLWQ